MKFLPLENAASKLKPNGLFTVILTYAALSDVTQTSFRLQFLSVVNKIFKVLNIFSLPPQNVHVCTRTKMCNCHKCFLTEVSVNGIVALKTWYNVMVDTSNMFAELKSTTLVLWT